MKSPQTVSPSGPPNRAFLKRYAMISIAAAIITIGMKTAAYLLTNSVGLFSDALESVVNLVGAVFAFVILIIAARPADDEHNYGHGKAEYFSSGAEGMLILFAALGIGITAVRRLFDPQPLEQIGLGLAISLGASLVNLGTALILLKAGKRYTSITLTADAHHLLTDVWTSAGVIAGIGLVAFTGWQILDPIVAIIVACNIVWVGTKIIRSSVGGLMDTALPSDEQELVQKILRENIGVGVEFHDLRTRQAGAGRFIAFQLLVPSDWSVQRGHDLLDRIEAEIQRILPTTTIDSHTEPIVGPENQQTLASETK